MTAASVLTEVLEKNASLLTDPYTAGSPKSRYPHKPQGKATLQRQRQLPLIALTSLV